MARIRITFVCLVLIFCGVGHASAQQSWVFTPLDTRGMETETVTTFEELLRSELRQRGVTFVLGSASCHDVACAAAQGRSVSAPFVLYGTVRRLGVKHIILVTVLDVDSETVLSSQKMSIDRVEDLEAAASRLGRAIAEGTSSEDSAQLGNITHYDSVSALRRRGDSGFGFHLAGVLPVGEALSGGSVFGVGLELSYWIETRYIAIEPRVGIRFAASGDKELRDWVEIPIDLGAYYIAGLGDVSAFVGGGIGIHHVYAKTPGTQRFGTVIQSSHQGILDDSQWGFNVFARGGVMLLRTYDVRVLLSLGADMTFIELNGAAPAPSFTMNAGVVF